jgi:predicted PurR-regulated permease PerM
MNVSQRDSSPGWTAGAVLRTASIVLALCVILVFAWKIRSILIVGFFGLLFGIVLSSAAGWLEKFRIPRAVGAPLIVLLLLGSLVGVGFLMAPVLSKQVEELRERIPQAIERLERSFGIDARQIGEEIAEGVGLETGESGPSQAGTPQGPQPEEGEISSRAEGQVGAVEPGSAAEPGEATTGGGGRLGGMVGSNLGRLRDILFPVASAAVDAIAGLLIIIFVALFFAVRPDLYRRGFLRMVPERSRDDANRILGDLADTLRQWLIARLIAMLAVGLIVGISLAVMRVEGAVVLGVIAGLLEFIPFFGPIASSLPAIGMAMIDSPQKALWVAILFLVVQQIEGNLITPLVLQNRVDVPPILTILSVPALMIIFGLIGGLVAEPFLAVAIVLTRKLWVERHADRMG